MVQKMEKVMTTNPKAVARRPTADPNASARWHPTALKSGVIPLTPPKENLP